MERQRRSSRAGCRAHIALRAARWSLTDLLRSPRIRRLDSGAYFLNLLWNWFLTPGLYRPELLLEEPLIFDAANLLVDVWCVAAVASASP